MLAPPPPTVVPILDADFLLSVAAAAKIAEDGWGRIHWNCRRVSIPGGASTYSASMPVGALLALFLLVVPPEDEAGAEEEEAPLPDRRFLVPDVLESTDVPL